MAIILYLVPLPPYLFVFFLLPFTCDLFHNRSNTSHGISEEIATAVFSITPNPIVNEINENANPANAATSLTTTGSNGVEDKLEVSNNIFEQKMNMVGFIYTFWYSLSSTSSILE